MHVHVLIHFRKKEKAAVSSQAVIAVSTLCNFMTDVFEIKGYGINVSFPCESRNHSIKFNMNLI